MPYRAHFGLKDHPFSLTPNTYYYFPSQEHANIFRSLQFAISRNSGIIKVVGEVGTGKTLLCRLLLRKLVENEAVAYLNAPSGDRDHLLQALCREFALPDGDQSRMVDALNRFLIERHTRGQNVILVVDEAQALGISGLETIRLLSNLETERTKLLQIVLFGQQELDDLLAQPTLRQLNQRIVFAFQTKPLTKRETIAYIRHRVKCSRMPDNQDPIFEDGALGVLASASRGIPRIVNILCDKALLTAFAAGDDRVTRRHARDAIRDSEGLAIMAVPWWRRLRNGWAAGGVAVATLGLVLGLSGDLRAWVRDGLGLPQARSAEPPPISQPGTDDASPR